MIAKQQHKLPAATPKSHPDEKFFQAAARDADDELDGVLRQMSLLLEARRYNAVVTVHNAQANWRDAEVEFYTQVVYGGTSISPCLRHLKMEQLTRAETQFWRDLLIAVKKDAEAGADLSPSAPPPKRSLSAPQEESAEMLQASASHRLRCRPLTLRFSSRSTAFSNRAIAAENESTVSVRSSARSIKSSINADKLHRDSFAKANPFALSVRSRYSVVRSFLRLTWVNLADTPVTSNLQKGKIVLI